MNPCEYVEKRNFTRFYDRIPQSVEKRTINDHDCSLLMEELHRSQQKKPEYIPSYAVELAIYTGMRVGEIAALRWDHIIYEEGYILIQLSEKYDRKTKTWKIESTKTGKSRKFPLSNVIVDLLKRIRKAEMKYGFLGEYVFQNQEGRIKARAISHCSRYRCKKANIDEKSIHAFRRTLNSKMMVAGVSAVVAASMLGHTEKVNQLNYTYDISQMEYKRKIISEINYGSL